MTELLEKVFDEASKLPPEHQNSIASPLLEELKPDRNWDQAFGNSQNALGKLANDALAEDERGNTEDLDPSTL